MPDCVPQKGSLSKRNLSKEELDDAKLGWQTAKEIGRLDIGQTVVVSKGMVVAVEAIEGTDKTILRAGELTQNGGGIFVKSPKTHPNNPVEISTIEL